MHRYANPSRFIRIADTIFPWAGGIMVAAFVIGLYLALLKSPADYQQSEMVRIMYIHVPSAWLSLMTYLIMTIYSIVALAFRMPFGFIVNTAVAPIGAVFTLICIVSGSL